MKAFVMLIRRELWEHRSLWMTPVIISAVLIVAVIFFGSQARFDAPFSLNGQPMSIDQMPASLIWTAAFISLSVPYYLAAAILVTVYLLDSLYGERRDRSILFWRSLPVADHSIVLAKLCTGVLVAPLLHYLLLSFTGLAVVSFAYLRGAGDTDAVFGAGQFSAWWRAQQLGLAALFGAILLYLPYAAYLLMVSAWAKRNVWGWAIIPPLLVAVIERLLFRSSYIGRLVLSGFTELTQVVARIGQQLKLAMGDIARGDPLRGGPPDGGAGMGGAGMGGAGMGPAGAPRAPPGLDRLDPAGLFDAPHLWVGLALAALMICAAIILRRRVSE